jgi:hypothetical protein
MSDEAIIVKGQGTIFLGGPPLVKAATGEIVTPEELGGADVHTRKSGVADHYAMNDAHALSIARSIVGNLNRAKQVSTVLREPREPLYPTEELRGVIPADTRKPYDVREVIARCVDASELDEFKQNYGTTLVTGFAHIYGYPIGIIANNGILFSESALKAAHFIEPCSQRGIHSCSCRTSPASWWARIRNQRHRPRRRQDGHRRVLRACAQVHLHHRRQLRRRQLWHVRPRLLAQVPVDVAERALSVMGGAQAASVLATVKRDGIEARGGNWSKEEEDAFKQPILEQYEHNGHPYYASARLWDDGVIAPEDTAGCSAWRFSAAQRADRSDALRRVQDVTGEFRHIAGSALPASEDQREIQNPANLRSTRRQRDLDEPPGGRNAFNETMIVELTQAFKAADADIDLRAVVLAGQGPAFCAGATCYMRKNVQLQREGEPCRRDAAGHNAKHHLHDEKTDRRPRARTAFAGGMGLVAACDIAVAAQEAEFCLSKSSWA